MLEPYDGNLAKPARIIQAGDLMTEGNKLSRTVLRGEGGELSEACPNNSGGRSHER